MAGEALGQGGLCHVFPFGPTGHDGPGAGSPAGWTSGSPGLLAVWGRGESARNWEEVLKDLRKRGVRRVRVFVTDDLPGLGGLSGGGPATLCAPCGAAGPESGPPEGPAGSGRGPQEGVPSRGGSQGPGSPAGAPRTVGSDVSPSRRSVGEPGRCPPPCPSDDTFTLPTNWSDWPKKSNDAPKSWKSFAGRRRSKSSSTWSSATGTKPGEPAASKDWPKSQRKATMLTRHTKWDTM